jgi:glycosyltransferase involved in cell wall biosynthesis
MTIVVNGRFLKGRATGLHRVGRGLLDAVRAAGLDVEVIAPAAAADPRVDRALPALPGLLGDHFFEQVQLPLAARGRPVLSLANTAPLATARSVVLVADLAPIVGPGWYSPRGRAYGRLLLAAARRAKGVLVYTDDVRRQLPARGIAAPAFVVRPAVDERFRPAPASEVVAVRDRLRLDKPYLLFVGWADPRKDVGVAVAAHRVVAAEEAHDLVLVGSAHPTFTPVNVPELPGIRRVGAVPDEDLVPLLCGAAALVYPSRYEGFGLPPLEAVACGTPALVSDIPVHRESVGAAGTYVPPGDVAAWSDAFRRALRGELVAGVPPEWSWADAGTQLLEALGALGYR